MVVLDLCPAGNRQLVVPPKLCLVCTRTCTCLNWSGFLVWFVGSTYGPWGPLQGYVFAD